MYLCLIDGAVRLINSSTFGTSSGSSSGRLEIYYNREWGTICNDGFDQTEADIVCQQLGYDGANKYGVVRDLGYVYGCILLFVSRNHL